jgi:hypothetical protein
MFVSWRWTRTDTCHIITTTRRLWQAFISFKADSHIACRAHTVPLPCRAAKGLECVFPIWFTQCSRVWFTLAMPRPCHALTMPFFPRPQHSTAVERRPVGYLPAFGFFRLSRGVSRRLLSEAYQSSSQRSIPAAVKSGSSTLQKGQSVKLLDKQFGYFRLPRGLSQRSRHCRSRVGERHGMCELTHGMAWERHGHGMLCVNPPLHPWPGVPGVTHRWPCVINRAIWLIPRL